MRIGIGLRLGSGRPTLALTPVRPGAPAPRRWADTDTWNDLRSWSDTE